MREEEFAQSSDLALNTSFSNVLKFTFPSIMTMLVMALYMTIDGIFVSRFVNTDALSAINIVYPLLNLVFSIAIMFSAGSSAIISKLLGEQKNIIARKSFSLIILIALSLVLLLCALLLIIFPSVIHFLGGSGKLYQYCYDYALTLTYFMPMALLQVLFQQFFIVAAKPKIGLFLTILAGFTNIFLDYLFIVEWQLGIKGAAYATGISFSIPAVIGLFYFSFRFSNTLYFVRPKFNFVVLYRSIVNGSSEMVSSLSFALTTYLYNITMLKFAGSDGVAAITVILYMQFVLSSLFMGYSNGVSPLFGFNYGAKKIDKVQSLFKTSLLFIFAMSFSTAILASFFSEELVNIFAKENQYVVQLGIQGMNILAFSYVLIGINIFSSALFTSLSNGKISAITSFVRTFIILSASIVILPKFFGILGVWFAIPFSELLAFLMNCFFITRYRKIYSYY